MNELFEKISGIAYPIVAAGIVLGLAWSGFGWLESLAGSEAAARPWISRPVAVGAAVVATLSLTWTAEKLIPLRGMSQAEWMHRFRPRGRHPVVDKLAVMQIGGALSAGFALGLVVGSPRTIAVMAVISRIGFALGRRDLPALLRGGKSRELGDATRGIQDSELVSDVFASSWGDWAVRGEGRPSTVSARPVVLFFRRLARRQYVSVIAVIIVAVTVAIARVGASATAAFLVAWSILGAGLYRCADFSRLGVSTPIRWLVLVVHGAVAATIVWGLWGMTQPAMAFALIVAGVVYVGRVRGVPRGVDNFAVVDTGVGVTMPPGILAYYLSGLGLGGAALIAAAFVAV